MTSLRGDNPNMVVSGKEAPPPAIQTFCFWWESWVKRGEAVNEQIRLASQGYRDVPVTSSRTSLSVVFRKRRSRAGTPPQFLSVTLLSSVALPYTRFLRAPQALFWTSATLWSRRSTRCWIPPRWQTCRRGAVTLNNVNLNCSAELVSASCGSTPNQLYLFLCLL